MRAHPSSLALAAAIGGGLFAGCASVSPSPSAVAVELAPGSGLGLRIAHALWIDPSEPPEAAELLREAVGRMRRVELAGTRDQADLVLYFEQANRLRCLACRQPEDLWNWWGFVLDGSGRELVSLHGEAASEEAAPRQFVAEVKTLLRRAQRNSRGT